MPATLEHINVTVSDLDRAITLASEVFGWHVRWRGHNDGGGETAHVGTDTSYIAYYCHHDQIAAAGKTEYAETGKINHVGIVVDDLDLIETKVRALGFTPHLHANYEPGRRFYFYDSDGIEYEVVAYA